MTVVSSITTSMRLLVAATKIFIMIIVDYGQENRYGVTMLTDMH